MRMRRIVSCWLPMLVLALYFTSAQAAVTEPQTSGGQPPVTEETGPASSPEQDDPAFPELKYFQAPALFLCPVHLPADYDPQRSYPLVIGLHGYASSPERYHSLYYAFDDPEFIYAAPQAPYPLPMGSSLGFSWFTGEDDEELVNESVRLAELYVIDLIEQLQAQYNVSDVYLLGFSQGGCLAYVTGIKHRELFKGLICFACWFDPAWFDEETIATATDLPIFIAHAEDDPAVEFSKGEEARDQLEADGFDVEFLPFVGGHTLTSDALKQVEAWIEEVSKLR